LFVRGNAAYDSRSVWWSYLTNDVTNQIWNYTNAGGEKKIKRNETKQKLNENSGKIDSNVKPQKHHKTTMPADGYGLVPSHDEQSRNGSEFDTKT